MSLYSLVYKSNSTYSLPRSASICWSLFPDASRSQRTIHSTSLRSVPNRNTVLNLAVCVVSLWGLKCLFRWVLPSFIAPLNLFLSLSSLSSHTLTHTHTHTDAVSQPPLFPQRVEIYRGATVPQFTLPLFFLLPHYPFPHCSYHALARLRLSCGAFYNRCNCQRCCWSCSGTPIYLFIPIEIGLFSPQLFALSLFRSLFDLFPTHTHTLLWRSTEALALV